MDGYDIEIWLTPSLETCASLKFHKALLCKILFTLVIEWTDLGVQGKFLKLIRTTTLVCLSYLNQSSPCYSSPLKYNYGQIFNGTVKDWQSLDT